MYKNNFILMFGSLIVGLVIGIFGYHFFCKNVVIIKYEDDYNNFVNEYNKIYNKTSYDVITLDNSPIKNIYLKDNQVYLDIDINKIDMQDKDEINLGTLKLKTTVLLEWIDGENDYKKELYKTQLNDVLYMQEVKNFDGIVSYVFFIKENGEVYYFGLPTVQRGLEYFDNLGNINFQKSNLKDIVSIFNFKGNCNIEGCENSVYGVDVNGNFQRFEYDVSD